MLPDALELAITGPAARVGVVVDRALLDDVMTDAEGQPAALPLVQYMLTELFERRTGPILTREAYRSLGGLGGVVANRAEELFDELAPDGRAATRHLFGRLVSVGDGVADTRRRARRSELQSHHDASAMTQAIERFGAGRLLVFDHDGTTREPTVEIAHEALLTTWPRLRGWLDEDRDVLRSVAHISAASTAWEASGRDAGDLLRGARLADALAIEERAPDRLTGGEREFVTASRDAFEADQLRQHRQRRRLRTLLTVAAVLLVIASIAGVIAKRQSNRAEATADEALTRRLVAESARLASTKPDTAMLLALEARSREQSIDTLGAIERVWAHKPHAWLGLHVDRFRGRRCVPAERSAGDRGNERGRRLGSVDSHQVVERARAVRGGRGLAARGRRDRRPRRGLRDVRCRIRRQAERAPPRGHRTRHCRRDQPGWFDVRGRDQRRRTHGRRPRYQRRVHASMSTRSPH